MEAARQRYGGLSAAGKRRLLDELEAITGYHRKSLLRLLHRKAAAPVESEGPRRSGGPQAPSPAPLWPRGGSGAGAVVGSE